MVVEIKGQQLRIKVNNLNKYNKWGTQDVGSKGRLQRVAGKLRGTKDKWETQSWRLNLKDYKNEDEAINQIKRLYKRQEITETKKRKAISLIHKYFIKNKI